ncbi:ParA/MinD-like ATPase [Methanocaldococcus villosus KIN24-T80]|uniref:Iron-sulfur cluster carrier protein n=1 Tax=Methanocaldococcus villosus KIN24-T80 TaxID=1069083 RepID=N6VTC0_9EURY|nr:Mrp/NBP35 family ATP-binding protein [Methanocaldococcus villosus]ENN96441.1 ParA/MinD-like ATPase [Methanocaldococcus villosus KIN24-T80]
MECDRKDAKKLLEQQNAKIRERMSKIKHKIAILSGKGGVGKSTVTANLAVGLSLLNKKVGVLDGDIHGPNIPKILGANGEPMVAGDAILPIEVSGIKTISISYLLPDEATPVIWRGPRVSGAIRQFLADVAWGELDYLLIDTPPGTGDVQLTIMQSIPNIDGAIIVTTPDEISLLDVKKSISMCKMLNIPIIGIIENMSGFVCPYCNKEIDIFGKGAGEKIAKELGLRFLGRIPLDAKAREAQEKGKPMVLIDCRAGEAFKEIVNKIVEIVENK